jgi:hypothetical protein
MMEKLGDDLIIYFLYYNIDAFVKSQKIRLAVIPAKAGIQSFQVIISSLGSGFHRSDDFLRDHQYSILRITLAL